MVPPLEVRYLREPGVRGPLGPALLRFLLECGADEFSITVMALHDTQAPFADAFEDELEPYALPLAPRRTIGAPAPTGLVRPIRLWTLNAASLERLISFLDDGLFLSPPGPDGWLEDLAIYRRGELVFGIVSHEQEAVLRLTAAEHAEVAVLGIPTALTADEISY